MLLQWTAVQPFCRAEQYHAKLWHTLCIGVLAMMSVSACESSAPSSNTGTDLTPPTESHDNTQEQQRPKQEETEPTQQEPQNSEMKTAIKLIDAQSGVAGETGTAWTIEPDGSYRVEALFNGKYVLKRQGRLNEKEREQLTTIMRQVDSSALAAMPKDESLSANPRRMMLDMNDQRIELMISPSTNGADSDATRQHMEKQLMEAADSIDALLSPQ